MGNKDLQDHLSLLKQKNKFGVSAEQQEVIDKIMKGEQVLELEEDIDQPALDLPILRRRS